MRRIMEDIENEKFTTEEILKWAVIYPAIGMTVLMFASILIERM